MGKLDGRAAIATEGGRGIGRATSQLFAGEGRRDQILLFGVMLTTAVGSTGLQSVIPAIGRSLRIPDLFIGVAFSLSALLWSVAAPFWARRLPRHGCKRMVIIGLSGFIVSLLLSGAALSAAVLGWVPASLGFAGFVVARGIHGFFGAAAPPAAQALLVARTARASRTKALTVLASAFGLGTIIGPALAPFFVLPIIGLSGPPYIFALFGIAMLAAIVLTLSDRAAGLRLNGAPAAEPLIGAEPSDASMLAVADVGRGHNIRLSDPRIRPWVLIGLVSGIAQAIAGQTMAFLIIDRLALPPATAQKLIGIVLMSGAGAALLAQWGLIPRLEPEPRQLCVGGAALASVGSLGVVLATDLPSTAIAFALASLGFGCLRPGFTAGASLAVTDREQGSVAGRVTSTNGIVFAFGPALGIMMYEAWRPLPYLTCTVALLGLVPYGLGKLPRSTMRDGARQNGGKPDGTELPRGQRR